MSEKQDTYLQIEHEQSISEDMEIFQSQYYPPSFGVQLKEAFTKFWRTMLIPMYRDTEIHERKFRFELLKSKRSFIRRLKAPLTIMGLIIVFTVVTWAIFAPWISLYDEDIVAGVNPNAFSPPSPSHPLGTTSFGRDVYSRLIWGARASLTIGLGAILMSVFFGIILGLISAYYGGWVDNIIMRIMDIMMAFPGLIFALVLVQALGPELRNIMLAYGILGIPGYARLMRGAALQEINKPYVHAAQVSGASRTRIIFRHIFPNSFAPILVSFTFDIGGIVLSLAGLSFLGFGDPFLIEWGNDISAARSFIYSAPWAALWPGFGILITVLGFMLLGDGLRDALDPRIKE